jgi:hypothetical protein
MSENQLQCTVWFTGGVGVHLPLQDRLITLDTISSLLMGDFHSPRLAGFFPMVACAACALCQKEPGRRRSNRPDSPGTRQGRSRDSRQGQTRS